jgi:hypothetical protein
LERNRVLEEELGQFQRAVLSVVTEILGPRPELRALVADLSEIPGEVSGQRCWPVETLAKGLADQRPWGGMMAADASMDL